MPLWGPDDTFGRWLQLIIGLPLFVLGIYLECNYWTTSFHDSQRLTRYGALALIVFGGRCLWYAFTGRNNMNRDDF